MFESWKLKRSFARAASEVRRGAKARTLTFAQIRAFQVLVYETLDRARKIGVGTEEEIAFKSARTSRYIELAVLDYNGFLRKFSEPEQAQISAFLKSMSALGVATALTSAARKGWDGIWPPRR